MLSSNDEGAYSPSERVMAIDSDPYSPAIVQELLQGSTEWSQIHDIVKLTFKATLDVMKAHSEAIRELEHSLPTKASKTEVASGLSQKADISDVTKTVAEVAANIESRASLEEVQQLFESIVSKADLQYALSNKVGIEEMKAALEEKVEFKELEGGLRSVREQMDRLQDEVQQSLGMVAGIKELEEIRRELKEKATIKDVAEGLSSKANKESVANALNRKANRDELSAALVKKAEIEDLKSVCKLLEDKICARELDSINDVIKEHTNKISDIEQLVRTNAQEIQDVLNEKIDLGGLETEKKLINIEKELNILNKDIKDELKKLADGITLKADIEDLKVIQEEVNTKVNNDDVIKNLKDLNKNIESKLEDLKVILEQKANDIMKAEISKAASEIEQLRNDFKRVKESLVKLSDNQQRDFMDIQKNLKNAVENIEVERQDDQVETKREIDGIRKAIDLIEQRKCDRKELIDTKASLRKDIEVNSDEIKKVISDLKNENAKKFLDLTERINDETKEIQNKFSAELKRKPNTNDMLTYLDKKVDKSIILPLINQKADNKTIDIMKSHIEECKKEINNKANAKDLQRTLVKSNEQIEELRKEVEQKANIRDVCALIDAKANVKDLDRKLDQIEKELFNKVNTDELKSALYNQAVINKALCGENCLGRWLWKSGTIKSGYAIPWEVQSTNTCPENFIWDKGSVSILVVTGGMYEVILGFFSSKKPTVQLLVNGEAVLAPLNASR